jgi:hypothetical protein
VSEATVLHRQAMEIADAALAARRSGDYGRALKLFRKAFAAEKAAALLAASDHAAEPTRSVLLRSAAVLALDCEEPRDAERLLTLALSGDPPNEIAEEIRDLLEQVNFSRHLKLRGVRLAEDELQLSLAGGAAVGFGIARQEELVSRLTSTSTLLYRTAERKQGREFRERKPMPKALKERFEIFTSVPRAASMTISLRFGKSDQSELQGIGFGQAVVDEFVGCLDVFQRDPRALRQRISDDAYRRNFVELARQLAPDGEQVRQVGFTVVREGKERHVSLTADAADLQMPDHEPTVASQLRELKGELRSAEDIREHKFRLVVDGKPSSWIWVPPGMMDDIVRPMWGELVSVTAMVQKGKLVLNTIKRIAES